MPTPRPNKEYFNVEAFNPVWECGLNGAIFLGSIFVTFVSGLIIIGNDMVWLAVGGVTIITTLWRAVLWYGKWLDREYAIQQIEVAFIDRQSDELYSPTQKAQSKQAVWDRGSKVWLSYIIFALPYGLLSWLIVTLFTMHSS